MPIRDVAERIGVLPFWSFSFQTLARVMIICNLDPPRCIVIRRQRVCNDKISAIWLGPSSKCFPRQHDACMPSDDATGTRAGINYPALIPLLLIVRISESNRLSFINSKEHTRFSAGAAVQMSVDQKLIVIYLAITHHVEAGQCPGPPPCIHQSPAYMAVAGSNAVRAIALAFHSGNGVGPAFCTSRREDQFPDAAPSKPERIPDIVRSLGGDRLGKSGSAVRYRRGGVSFAWSMISACAD
jgi:hypothetical protein